MWWKLASVDNLAGIINLFQYTGLTNDFLRNDKLFQTLTNCNYGASLAL